MKKLLLVNPPARQMVSRDYYCGQFVKGNYLWEPIDLVMLSRLDDYEIKVIDFVIERDISLGLEKAKSFKPDLIIGLVWNKIFESDVDFLKKLQESTGAKKFFIVGDATKFNSPKLKELGLENNVIKSFYHLEDTGLGSFSMPRHNLFPLEKYSRPYSLREKVATVITAYACPYKCRFCNSGSFPYEERPLQEVIEELKELKRLGVKEIYFGDFTFTANQARVQELCRLMIEHDFGFDWSCCARVNVCDETLKLMKKAGCFLVFYGVETLEDRLLLEMRKGITVKMIKDAFIRTKKIGIKILASFILDLPGASDNDSEESLKFAKKYCDYASFNVFESRIGADLKSEKGLADKGILAEKEFYFRPGYVMRQLMSIKTVPQVKNLFKNGLAIFKK